MINSTVEYQQCVEQIKELKHRLWTLASVHGNLDRSVIRISQEMDEHIVAVQRYWQDQSEEWVLSIPS